MENEKEYTTITFRLPPEEKEAFVRIVKKRKWRQSVILRAFLEEWVKKHDKESARSQSGSME